MKYDSGMVQFHKDILTALRCMLKSNIEVTKKFKAGDASPAPLREYLKDSYGINGGGMSMGIYDNISKVKEIKSDKSGVKVEYLTVIGNVNDRVLMLSWSQVAKFIRDNWEEIFNNVKPFSDSEEKINMSKESYREVLKQQFPQLTDEMINRSACCPESFFSGDNIPFSGICGYKGDTSLCPACWDKPCEGTYNGDIFDPLDWVNYSEGDDKKQPTENEEKQPPAEQTSDSPDVFNYSVLDNDTATALRSCEQSIRQETINYFTILGEKLKEAQSLLASHAKGTFESWYSSLGLKRQTVYNLIQRFDFLSSPTVGGREDVFECLPLTLSYEVSKPNAPQELVEKVLDGNITSNAEYQKMKAELDEAVKRAELAELHEKNAHEGFKHVEEASHKNFAKYQEEHKKVRQLEDKIYELEKEAKSRPIEVAVQRDDKLLKEIERLKSENEQLKNSDSDPTDNGTKTFLMRITTSDFERLAELTKKDILLHDKIMRARIIKL